MVWAIGTLTVASWRIRRGMNESLPVKLSGAAQKTARPILRNRHCAAGNRRGHLCDQPGPA